MYGIWKRRQGKSATFETAEQPVIPAIFNLDEKESTKTVALEITTLIHLNLSTRYNEKSRKNLMKKLEVCARIYHANAPYLPLLLTEIVLSSLRDYTYDIFIIIDFMRLLMSRNQLSDNRVSVTVANVIERMDSLEETMPEIENLASDFFAKAVSKEVIGLETIAKYTTNGLHSSLMLIVLQKLCSIIGDAKLLKRCRLSEIDLMASLHFCDQTMERLEEILIERRLAALIPYAKACQSSSKDAHNLSPRQPSLIKASKNVAMGLRTANDRKKDERLLNDFIVPQAPVQANLSETKITTHTTRKRDVVNFIESGVAPKRLSEDTRNAGKEDESCLWDWDTTQSSNGTQLDILMNISQQRNKSRKTRVLPEFYAREVTEKRKLETQLKVLAQRLEKNGGLLESNSKLLTRIELMLNQIDLKDDLIKNMEIAEDC